jgi:N-dimethylarginine dimethylaminohydrolase
MEAAMAGVMATGAAFPQGWGVDNAFMPLRDVLLAKPDNFKWLPMNSISRHTFANMEKMGLRFDKQKAMSQHRQMVDIYERRGIRTHFIEVDEGLHYSIFARDSSFMTPWGAVIASIQTPARQRDYGVAARFYLKAGIPIWNWVSAGFFEGGDFVIVRPGVVMLGYAGDRSTMEGAEQVAGWMRAKGWEAITVPIPPQFVHMDAVVVMLGKDVALVCTDALEPYALDWLKGHGVRFIDVPYRECVKLGGNVVYLGNETIISMAHNKALNERLRAEGFTVEAPEFDMFTLGGGGVHCACHELRRDPAS